MAVQRSSSFFVRQNVLVNPFMTEGKTFAFENSRDLLRTEVLVQTLFNIRPYLKANALLPFTGLPFLTALVCLPVAVATRPGISRKFAAYS